MNTNHGIQTRTRFVHRVSKLKEPRKQRGYVINICIEFGQQRLAKSQADRVGRYFNRCIGGKK